MTPAFLRRAPAGGAAILACLLSVVVTARVITQAPGPSDGWQIPEGVETEQNPVAISPAVIAAGRRIYQSKCERCHGAGGEGDGPDRDVGHAPADLTDGRRAARNPDGVMFYKIWNGRTKPRMPPMKLELSRAEVWTVIHFVRTLRR